MKIGDIVEVEVSAIWLPAMIIDVNGDSYHIRFLDDDWNQHYFQVWFPASRIKMVSEA